MSSILSSITSNNVFILKLQVSTPGTVSYKDLNFGLIQAAKLGYLECAQCLLEAGADKEYAHSSNMTPLLTAVQNNKLELVKLFINNKCSPNFRGNHHSSPLHLAVRSGNCDMVDLLLEHGAFINSRDSGGNTPLILSAQTGNYGAMKSLIRYGCEINACNKNGLSALHFACQKARGHQVLLDAGADPDVRDEDDITPLLMAATEGFDGVVKALVEKNCDVNISNKSVRKTPLHILCFKGHADCVNPLVYGGADIDACDVYNRTPLWYAIQNGKVDVVRLLLKAYSHVDTFQCGGAATAYHCPARLAFECRQFDVVKFFILTGYDHCHVRECLQSDLYTDWLKSNQEHDHWLDFGASAQTLKQLCRKWIRHHLGRQFYHHLQFLPLPDMMKNYLYLEELHDH